jgi:hypothetical protein
MYGLLLDKKILIKHELINLLSISGKQPVTKDDLGIIFIIPNKQYILLNNISNGDDKLKYVNSSSFIKNICKSYFVYYSIQKKICEIRNHIDPEHITPILTSLKTYLPPTVIIWIGIIPIQECNTYILAGFDNPHVSNTSPLKHTFNTTGVSFSKPNLTQKLDDSTVRNKLDYVSQKVTKVCNIYAKFTPITVDYLKEINHPNKKNQKELAGSLIVNKVSKSHNKIVFELSPNHKSILVGDDEQVDAVWSRYNFHTHPKKAYENHGVTRGWPSSQDYVGFLGLDNHTIFHTVVTLEGIYIISISPEWTGTLKNVSKKYVYNNYNINHKKTISFKQYVDQINSTKYKGKQLFIVRYLDWNHASDTFPVYYAKTNDKCLATEIDFQMYK